MKPDQCDFLDWLLGGLLLFVIGFAGLSIYGVIQHQKFLEEHGCQEIHRSLTGRSINHGKFSTAESVIVFECKDGMRTELQS